MSITDQQLVCTRPYEWFEIHRHGIVFMCCPAWLKRPIGNLLEQSVSEIWNGQVARELRKSIANGSFHNCSKTRCPFLLSGQEPVQQFRDIVAPNMIRALSSNSGIVAAPPPRLNLCFDYRCNLACPSCREDQLLMDEMEKEKVRQITTIIKEQLLDSATEVTMSGHGDPFASPAYREVLQHLNQQGAQGPKLRLHSNGQLWTQKRWDQFSNLHDRVTAAEISVDAASADTYQRNRPGGDFSVLQENLEYLAQQPFPLTLSMVVQANNFAEIPQFVELAAKLHARVYLSQLVNWGTFDKHEFLARAVHLPDHPQHNQLRTVLGKICSLSRVDLGNLAPLLSGTS